MGRLVGRARLYDLEPDEIEDFHIEEFIGDIVEATSAANAAFHYRNLRVYFGRLVKRKEIHPRPSESDGRDRAAQRAREAGADHHR